MSAIVQPPDTPAVKRVGVVGLGAIGFEVASRIDGGAVPGLQLAGVCSRSLLKARRRVEVFNRPPAVMSASELAEVCEIVVECAPKSAFAEIAGAVLGAGRTLVTVSGAALLSHPQLVAMAHDTGGRIVLATGALLGLDAIRAAAEGEIYSVRIATRKPPRSLVGAPYLVERGIDVLAMKNATRIFKGSAADGAAGFPANVNVAAAVGFAGIGADATQLEIWADPALDRNTHTITVEADSANFEMRIENVPTEENPGTGKITALSVIAALRGERTAFRVGS